MSSTPLSSTEEPARWLLLVHQLPAKPAYLRVKTWRRLQALGAITVKNSVYVLPATERTREDLEWLLKEIVAASGEGLICEARVIDGMSDREMSELFNTAREADYQQIAKELRDLAAAIRTGHGAPEAISKADARLRLSRLKAQADQIAAIDFFGASGRSTVAALANDLTARLHEEATMAANEQDRASPDIRQSIGRLWVTRQGVHVDRIASAWLIKRFIDQQARFKFVPPKDYTPEPGEVRFDMYEGEFTHEGDRCTFEVLLQRAGLDEPALSAISEIVHDIDLKDRKFGREETSGIAHLISGIAAAEISDADRIERGAVVFDSLYDFFGRTRK